MFFLLVFIVLFVLNVLEFVTTKYNIQTKFLMYCNKYALESINDIKLLISKMKTEIK